MICSKHRKNLRFFNYVLTQNEKIKNWNYYVYNSLESIVGGIGTILFFNYVLLNTDGKFNPINI